MVSIGFAQSPDGRPLVANTQDGAYAHWLAKPVLHSKPLDGMEDLSHWTFSGVGEMSLSTEHVKQGSHSICMRSTDSVARVEGGGEWADITATRKFDHEDWSAYNRVSVWVYADVAGAPSISFALTLQNDGEHKLPDRYNEGRDESLNLQNHAWNHLVWELTPLSRDKVAGLELSYSLPKKYPDIGDKNVFYLDQLELQEVAPDHVEGWDVAPGKIAYSNSGYGTGSPKSAIASGLHADQFSVVRRDTSETVLTKPVETKSTNLGRYEVLDFSEVREPGDYFLRAGDVTTHSFHIGEDAWRTSILKAINFLYTERCGMEIPGVHGRCHQDCYTEHGDQRIVVNGGYHDAGDLSATGNTPMMAYAILDLADRLMRQQADPELTARLIEEAKWGLNWVLKTRFGDGYRSTGQLISYWTDNIMGDGDDRSGKAVNNPEWNFKVAAVEALAGRVLRQSDPDLGERSLKIAEEDWHFAVEGRKTEKPRKAVYGQPDELEEISLAALASADLYAATGNQTYADYAAQMAGEIVNSQERKIQNWSIPLTGYFYTSPAKDHLFHRFHKGEEQAPLVALARMCDMFPDHKDWMKWYAAEVLYSEYYAKPAAKLDAPFDMLPAGVFHKSEASTITGDQGWTPLRAADENSFLQQVLRGIPLGGDAYLRRFPVWFDFRGDFSVLLSQAKGLSTAAHLRGDLASVDIAEEQAEWVVGRNPFAASVMYGEGYDWEPLYSVRSGQIVGALPVGIETKGFNDAPYWPHQICWTYKEVWTHPVGRWLWLMQDLAGPAIVEGTTVPGAHQFITFREGKSGAMVRVPVDIATGIFRAPLGEGQYTVTQDQYSQRLTVLPGGYYRLNLLPDHRLSFDVSSKISDKDVTIEISGTGAGEHQFAIRGDNLAGVLETKEGVFSKTPRTISWHLRVVAADEPWTVVVIADDNTTERKEVTGVPWAGYGRNKD
ncbi:MAG: glycoside hydrolase family 9 protein [Bryobacteraceae bacterium]